MHPAIASDRKVVNQTLAVDTFQTKSHDSSLMS
jgi:hypothetical protein